MTEGPLRTFFLLLSLAASPLSSAEAPHGGTPPGPMVGVQKATRARLPPGHDTPPQAAAYITTRHRDEWVSWRCGLVTSMVRQVTEEARAIRPTVQINLHLVPWRRDDFAEPSVPSPGRTWLLRQALAPPSRGVVFWSWQALEDEPEKKAVLRTLLKR